MVLKLLGIGRKRKSPLEGATLGRGV